MKTPEPPRSSKGKDKAEENADVAMVRFRRLATKIATVSPDKVRAEEEKLRSARRKRD
jgi:hypothetical protein